MRRSVTRAGLSLLLALAAVGAEAAGKGRDACFDTEATPQQTITGCNLVLKDRKREGRENVASALYNRGLAYYNLDQYDRAVADLTEVIRLNENNADAFRLRGRAYVGQERNDLALADYERAIRLSPEEENGYNDRGALRQAMGAHDLAIADFGESIRLNPEAALYRLNRGLSYEAKGDVRSALTDLEEAARLDAEREGVQEAVERVRALAAAARPAPLAPREARLAAYLWGVLMRDKLAQCDIATTAKQRAGLEARLASLRPEVGPQEAALRQRVGGAGACPEPERAADLAAALTAFAEKSPEGFAAEMDAR